MTEERLQDALSDVICDPDCFALAGGLEVVGCRTFEDAGVLTGNKGLVVRLSDGSEFQVTIVRSK